MDSTNATKLEKLTKTFNQPLGLLTLEAFPIGNPVIEPTMVSFDESYTRHLALKSIRSVYDIEEIKKIKQKEAESVHDYTSRFYDKLYNCLPDLDSRITDQEDSNEGNPFSSEDNYLRKELFSTCLRGLAYRIANHTQIPTQNLQCVKTVSEQAHAVEETLKLKGFGERKKLQYNNI
uniref:CCHC-type domain-containing protein n=1 Tax=Strongyloides stercoralis TaxID=6248 RepID=A0AAF5DRZ9_STRER